MIVVAGGLGSITGSVLPARSSRCSWNVAFCGKPVTIGGFRYPLAGMRMWFSLSRSLIILFRREGIMACGNGVRTCFSATVQGSEAVSSARDGVEEFTMRFGGLTPCRSSPRPGRTHRGAHRAHGAGKTTCVNMTRLYVPRREGAFSGSGHHRCRRTKSASGGCPQFRTSASSKNETVLQTS
jgi:hypothetical protein